MSGGCTFGVFLNLGANLAATPAGVFELTRREAELAEDCGYHDLWVTEHHFIRFGINPSALVTAGFLLGRTRRVRVGTAVVLSPLCNRVELAERAALLDQLGEGRFDLGLGRGGYAVDYEVLGVDTARWDGDPAATIDALLELWAGSPLVTDRTPPDGVSLQPAPFTAPHPPVLVATSTDAGIVYAARRGMPLQHYFASPPQARIAVEERYAAAVAAEGNGAAPPPAHLHSLIVVVTDRADEGRARLAAALTESFRAGDHPAVPQSADRHVGPDGKPYARDEMAAVVAQGAIVGSIAQVVDELGTFIAATGARRLAVYHEAIADPSITLDSIERFVADVIPQLGAAVPADAAR